MTDIVAELRGLMPLVLTSVRVTLGIAAAEIERLRKASAGEPAPQVSSWQPIEDLREALTPFAHVADQMALEGVTDRDFTSVTSEMSHEDDAKVLASLGLPERKPAEARTERLFCLDGLQVRDWLRLRKALTALPAPPSVEAIPDA